MLSGLAQEQTSEDPVPVTQLRRAGVHGWPQVAATGTAVSVNRHLRFLNLPLQHQHFGPRADPDRWKHRTLRRRDKLGWLRRLEGM